MSFHILLVFLFFLSCKVLALKVLHLVSLSLLPPPIFGFFHFSKMKNDREVTTIHAAVDGPWTGVRLALLSYCCSFFLVFCSFWFLFLGPLSSVLSFLICDYLCLVEGVLTLLWFFLIVRMEISQFLWEIYFSIFHTFFLVAISLPFDYLFLLGFFCLFLLC